MKDQEVNTPWIKSEPFDDTKICIIFGSVDLAGFSVTKTRGRSITDASQWVNDVKFRKYSTVARAIKWTSINKRTFNASFHHFSQWPSIYVHCHAHGAFLPPTNVIIRTSLVLLISCFRHTACVVSSIDPWPLCHGLKVLKVLIYWYCMYSQAQKSTYIIWICNILEFRKYASSFCGVLQCDY